MKQLNDQALHDPIAPRGTRSPRHVPNKSSLLRYSGAPE